MAYHQGTVWVYPLGAYYLACLKVYGSAAARQVREQPEPLEAMLRVYEQLERIEQETSEN